MFFFSSRRRHTRCALVNGVQTCALPIFRRERTIEVGADAAWAIVGAPDLLHLWFPGIVSCTVEGDRRTITTRTGLAMEETILTSDNLTRRVQYRIDGRHFTEPLGTLHVHTLGPGRSLLAQERTHVVQGKRGS